MKYNYQNNLSWKNEIMTEGIFQGKNYKDFFGRWGCLVTCIANIMQDFSLLDFNPKKLNELIKNHNLYLALSGKASSIDNTSFLDVQGLSSMFNFNVIKTNNIDDNSYYIANINFMGSGHFVNVISKKVGYVLCYNTWDNNLEFIPEKNINFYYKINFGK